MIGLQTAAQRQQLREQRQQVREQAERVREEALEAAREAREAAREAAEDAAREARTERAQEGREIHLPPPPPPPGQHEIIVHPRGPWEEPAIPGEVVDIVQMLAITTAAVLILRPLMRAFANRFERRGMSAALPPEVTAHMERLEQAVEAVAIEVERISEGQRYTTKLLSERAGKGG
ncbi:MAG: hypothetical protein ABR499_13225 [Gemmatimonadaceae bacterium]